jgi:hypothetical protein
MRPYIEQALQQGSNLNQNYTQEYFPGSTVAGQSPYTQQGIDQLAGFGGSTYNQNLISNAMAAQQNLADAQYNPAALAGLNQTSNSLPYFDWLRARSLVGGPGLAGTVQSGGGLVSVPDTGQNAVAGASGGPTTVEQTANAVGVADPLNSVINRPLGSNPYTDQVVQNTLAQNTQNFNQQVLPQIQNEAQIQGGFGGSRQGVAEGIAQQGLADANARAAASIYNDAYNQDAQRQLAAIGMGGQLQSTAGGLDLQRDLGFGSLGLQGLAADRGFGLAGAGLGLQTGIADQAFTNAMIAQALQGSQMGTGMLMPGLNLGLQGSQASLALSPGMQQLGSFGTQSLLAAGDIDQAYRQALLNDEVNAFNFNQAQPFVNQNQFLNALGLGGGLSGMQTSMPQSSGGFAGALGGAATGAGILGGMQAMGGSAAALASSPWGWGILALSALAGAYA